MARAKTRKLFSGRNSRENTKAINDFMNEASGLVRTASRRAISSIAARGLATLVKNAKFSDYTGRLVQSYQATIWEDGELELYGGSFGKGGNIKQRATGNVFKDARDRRSVFTSENYPGTTPIDMSYHQKHHPTPIRKRRNPKSPDEFRTRTNGRGFGRDLTVARYAGSRVKTGLEVRFTNPAPYAEQLDRSFHSVFPEGADTSVEDMHIAFSITQQELKRVLGLYNKRKKR